MMDSLQQELSSTMIGQASFMRPQRRRVPYKFSECKVCGKTCRYCYYSVNCCEGCKQFFRRTLADKKTWMCQGENNKKQMCNVVAAKNKCKSCRLDRCLMAGLDWKTMSMGVVWSDYSTKLDIRRLEMSKTMTTDIGELKFFLRLVDAQLRIMHAYTEFDDSFDAVHYDNKFSSPVEQLLKSDYNLLSKAHQFSMKHRQLTQEEIAQLSAEIEQLCYLHPRVLKFDHVDCLVCLGLIKLMPIVMELELKDKVQLVQQMTTPLIFFLNRYSSYAIGSDTLKRLDGGDPMIMAYKLNKYGVDKKFMKLADTYFTDSMEPFTRTRLSREEFALLLPIYITQIAGIQGLSERAKELLYEESCRYAKMLLRYCQHRQSTSEAGAKRFSECIQLVNHCFYAFRCDEMLLTYMETFYVRKCVHSGPFSCQRWHPKCAFCFP